MSGLVWSGLIQAKAARVEMLVHLGELSSAKQAVEGASVAPGSNQTLAMSVV